MNLFKFINKYKVSGILHVFDMDDTLFDVPTFADMVGTADGAIVDIDTKNNFGEYLMNVKSAFWDILSKNVYFKRSGDFIVPFNKSNDLAFSGELIDNFRKNREYSRMLDVHDNVLVVAHIPGMHSNPDTLGLIENSPVMQAYENADNKMILTGRPENLRVHIMSILKYLGISFPNYGLKLFQADGKTNIEQFKVQTILRSIKENEWNTVHFYEDRLDWLNATKEAVATMFPSVTFVGHQITNLKEKRRLNMT